MNSCTSGLDFLKKKNQKLFCFKPDFPTITTYAQHTTWCLRHTIAWNAQQRKRSTLTWFKYFETVSFWFEIKSYFSDRTPGVPVLKQSLEGCLKTLRPLGFLASPRLCRKVTSRSGNWAAIVPRDLQDWHKEPQKETNTFVIKHLPEVFSLFKN